MTEDEMKKRIKEIDDETYKLKEERKTYKEYLKNENLRKEYENHKSYIGKYYKLNEVDKQEIKHIKAFKIIDVLKDPNEKFATCLILGHGNRNNCWTEYGIDINIIGLWTSIYPQLFTQEGLKVIDYCGEITEDEFMKLYDEHLKIIEKVGLKNE